MKLTHPGPAIVLLAGLLITNSAVNAGEITGVVKDAQGKPVLHATVLIDSDAILESSDGLKQRPVITSDTNGRFRFAGLPTGMFVATATFPLRAPGVTKDIEIKEPATTAEVEILLGEMASSVVGSLRISSGSLPPDVSVMALRTTTGDMTIFAADVKDGNYQLSLSPGHYLLKARGTGWQSSDKSIVMPAQAGEIDLVLHKHKNQPSEPLLAAELKAMAAADQDIRNRGIQAPKDKSLHGEMRAVDTRNETRLKEIIQKTGWPKMDLVGVDGVGAAWLIAQHGSTELINQCLPFMKAAAEQGEMDWATVALTIDRALIRAGKKQIYGTQGVFNASGDIDLEPIDDEAHVDERRSKIGLGPIAEYLAQMRQFYKPAAKKN